MFNHKKAEIASTMTWFVAFIIILFIMLLFLAGVASLNLNPTRERPDISFGEASNENINHGLNYKLLIFSKENHETISSWIDTQGNEYFRICDLFEVDNLDFDLSDGFLLFQINQEKNVLIEELNGKISCVPSNRFYLKSQMIGNIIFISDNEIKSEVLYVKK